MLTYSNFTSGGRYLIMCVTVESLCFILETNIILYNNYTSIKNKLKRDHFFKNTVKEQNDLRLSPESSL